jgi:branched-chain amino acid transport system permease protein
MSKTARLSFKHIRFTLPLLVALLVPLLVTNPFYLHLITLSCIWSILASSLNICMGYTGLVSVAQGSFFGIGAYATSLLVIKAGLNYWATIPLALGLVVLISLGIGLIALRTRGPYFVIFSLCVCLIITVIIERWETVTEGPRGLSTIPAIDPLRLPGVGEISFTSAASQYYLILFFLLITLLATRLLIYSRFGRAFEAVHLNEVLADSLGINVMATKIFSFSVAAFFAGLAGVLYPPYISYLGPADSSFWVSFNTILYVVVGGRGTLIGPLIGAFSMTIIPEILRFLAEFRLLFYGLVLIIAVIFLPRGLVSLPGLIKARVGRLHRERR